MTGVTVALRMIRDRIATASGQSGRNHAEIRLVAVSKTHPAALIEQALEAGQREFAENYLQEAIGKIQNLAHTEATWHYIGRIQSNKTRAIAAHFDWVQTVASVRIARRLGAQRDAALAPLNVCLQVRLSGDPGRPGADPRDLPALAAAVEEQPQLRLRGLMCMPPLEADADATARHFAYTHRLFGSLRSRGHMLDTLSMGTSNDLETAIASGSTLVRVGTAIFGPRAPG